MNRIVALLTVALAAAPALADAVEVPMARHEPIPVVQVKVNGQGPFLFLLDTGMSAGVMVDERLVERVAIEKTGSMRAFDGARQQEITIETARVASLELGEFTVRDQMAVIRDLSDFDVFKDTSIDGIVGIGAFAEHSLTLDYAQRKVLIDAVELTEADGKTILPLVRDRIPAIEITIGDETLVAHLDSGNAQSIRVPTDLGERLTKPADRRAFEARGGSGAAKLQEATLPAVITIGSIRLESPTVHWGERGRTANLGTPFLRDYVTTIDLRSRLVRITPAMEDDTRE